MTDKWPLERAFAFALCISGILWIIIGAAAYSILAGLGVV